MNPKTRARSIAMLERYVADSTKPETFRRAASLRLARMKTATRPAPDHESLLRGKLLARDTFLTLHAQRRALVRKPCRTAAEDRILGTLLTTMPDTMPDGAADNGAWCNFVGAVSRTLGAIKSLPTR